MGVKKLISSYAAFNLNAKQQFVNWLKNQQEEQLQKEIPSSFNSVLQTLNHIWAIEEVWSADLFKNNDFVNRYGAQDLKPHEVFEGLLNRSTKIAAFVSQLLEEDLNKKITLEKPWFTANLTLAEYLLHSFNHGTYHRGQIITQAHSLGFTDMPSTDFLFYSIAMSNK
jgi:uncharacterized damage-inducible protein DinB